MFSRSLLRAVMVVLSLVVISASTPFATKQVEAATFIIVNDMRDVVDATDGRCTLREAVIAANKTAVSGSRPGECAAGSRDTVIQFTITSPIVLQATLPPIERNISIIGGPEAAPGAVPPVTIDGGGMNRIMVVRSGTVRVQRIHFTRGLAQGGNGGTGSNGAGGGGGGAGMGGAIFIAGGSVTIENSRFTANQAVGGKGGDALVTGGIADHGGGGGGGMGAAGSPGGLGQGGTGGGGSAMTDDNGLGGVGGGYGQDGQVGTQGAGGGGAGPGRTEQTSGKGGFGGYGGGGGGAGSGGPSSGFAGAGGYGGGGGGGGINATAANGGNGGGAYGGNGGNTSRNSNLGGGGGGGAGLGGAIFVQRGTHTLIDNQFTNNSAFGGIQGAGRFAGGPGFGDGGAVFVAPDAQVYNIGEIPTFPDTSNTAGNPQGMVSNNVNEVDNFQVKPLVSLSIIQQPSLGGPTAGQFRISRRGPVTGDLVVDVQVEGTAVPGTEYTASPNLNAGTVTIPANQNSVIVSVMPVPDQPEAAGRTISLELIESPDDYVINSTPNATMTIGTLPPPAWLVLLYVAAEDVRPAAEKSDTLALSLNEPARDLLSRLVTMPANANLRIVVLFDGNGEDPDSRILVRQPGTTGELLDVTALVQGSGAWPGFPYNAAQDSLELDTGRTDTLRNFITWARQAYPDSQRSMLSVIDHGGGWAPDFGSQLEQPRVNRLRLAGDGRGLSIDAQSGRSLSTRNTGEIFAGLGDLGQFDLIFFDACLMGMVESAYEIQPYTRYFVAGQNLLWAELPYERYFKQITQDTTPRELAANLVNNYGLTLEEPHTIAAIEMAQLPLLRAKIAQLAQLLIAHLEADPSAAANIRDAYLRSQKFDYDVSMTIDQSTDGYVDIGSIAQELKAENFSSQINSAADEVVLALRQAVLTPPGLRAKNGAVDTDFGAKTWNFNRASGLSIYMPLGERDCRPTALASEGTNAPCDLPAEQIDGGEARLYEDQFSYYENPDQLAFTRDAKPWSELLGRLRVALGDNIPEPSVPAAAPPYLLQTATLTVTTGTSSAGPLQATIRGLATTGTWDSTFFQFTTVKGSYAQAKPVPALSDTIGVTESVYSAVLQGLQPTKTYYYRFGATRGATTLYGGERSFTTPYYRIWLPTLINETRGDLEVVSIEVRPTRPRVGEQVEVFVTIRNNGPGPIGSSFWVDLYVNPFPNRVLEPNVLWNDAAPLGATWRVYGLGAEGTKVLRTTLPGDELDPASRYSEFSRFVLSGSNELVVLVDSYEPGDTRGAVDEIHEDNNLFSQNVLVDEKE